MIVIKSLLRLLNFSILPLNKRFSFLFMPGYRRYRRRNYPIYRSMRTKYSNETYSGTLRLLISSSAPNPVGGQAIIPASNILGTRKCKNFTLRLHAYLASFSGTDLDPYTVNPAITALLVYVPEGTEPSVPQAPTGGSAISVYEPNQNVIVSGLVDNSQTYSLKTRLARNLNSNDALFVMFQYLGPPAQSGYSGFVDIVYTVNYAVAF